MSLSERALSGLGALVVVFCVAVLAFSGLIEQNPGRNSWMHYGTIPSSVVQLDPSNYLVKPGSSFGAGQICKHGDSQSNGNEYINESGSVSALPGYTYIQCVSNQVWSTDPISKRSFGGQLSRTLTLEPFWAVIAAIGVLFELPALNDGLLAYRRRRTALRVKKEKHLQLLRTANAEREALAASWARDEITEEQFETAQDKINQRLIREGRDN